MKAKIKKLMSSDIDIYKESPADLSCFEISLELEIGPFDGEGQDLFQITICSTEWIEQHSQEYVYLDDKGSIFWWARPRLVMQKYDRVMLFEFLKREIELLEGNDWIDVAKKINLMSIWEFDNYDNTPPPFC